MGLKETLKCYYESPCFDTYLPIYKYLNGLTLNNFPTSSWAEDREYIANHSYKEYIDLFCLRMVECNEDIPLEQLIILEHLLEEIKND